MNYTSNTKKTVPKQSTLFPEWTNCSYCGHPVERKNLKKRGTHDLCWYCDVEWDEDSQCPCPHVDYKTFDDGGAWVEIQLMDEKTRQKWDAAWIEEWHRIKAETTGNEMEFAQRIGFARQRWKSAWRSVRSRLNDEEELDQWKALIEEERRQNFAEQEQQYNEQAEEERKIKEIAEEEPPSDYFMNPPQNKNSVFELNLAEFPIAILDKSAEIITELRYSDMITGRNGEKVERKWAITAKATDEEGNPLGFGGPATLEVINELLQMWREQKHGTRRIFIGTYHNFLKRLGWGTGKNDYVRLKQTLQCIHEIHITGQNCFYIKSADAYVNLDPGIYLFPSMGSLTKSQIDPDHPDARYYVSMSDELYRSVTNNGLFYFDISQDYFKKLTPMEQKLGLILTKYFKFSKNKTMRSRNIKDLAKQIPIMSEAAYTIRRQLKRVCNGLIEKKFKYLARYEIEKDNITFYNRPSKEIEAQARTKEITPKYVINDSLLSLMMERLKCDEKDKPFLVRVVNNVPEVKIHHFLSTAVQEGRNPIKLFNKLVTDYINQSTEEKTGEDDFSEQTNLFSAEEVKTTIDPAPPKPEQATEEKDRLFEEKRKKFESLPTEKRTELIEWIRKERPILEGMADDSDVVIYAVADRFITNDIEIVPPK